MKSYLNSLYWGTNILDLDAMAWAKPKYPKREINNAGAFLSGAATTSDFTLEKLEHALQTGNGLVTKLRNFQRA